MNKRYIVYPQGALSWDEIFETVELLKTEGANPKIVKYNGFWNVSAEREGKTMNNRNTEEAELRNRLLGSFRYLRFFHRELSEKERKGLESDIKILVAQLREVKTYD